jgi:hypothetical protein
MYHKAQHFKILRCDHVELVCILWPSEQTANFALQDIKRLVFITEMESVYSAVRTESFVTDISGSSTEMDRRFRFKL